MSLVRHDDGYPPPTVALRYVVIGAGVRLLGKPVSDHKPLLF